MQGEKNLDLCEVDMFLIVEMGITCKTKKFSWNLESNIFRAFGKLK